MSVETLKSAPERILKKPRQFLEGFRQKVVDARSFIARVRFDYETRTQGTKLITEASNLLLYTSEYKSKLTTAYQEASNYRSIERPMNIGAEFSAGGTKYNVRVTEAQNTDPVALLMLINNPGNKTTEPDVRIQIDLRRNATRGPIISYYEKEQDTFGEEKSPEVQKAEAIRNIRQTLAALRKNLGLPPVNPVTR